MIRTFRLTNEPGGLGLSFTDAGVSLAGVPLLYRTNARLAANSKAFDQFDETTREAIGNKTLNTLSVSYITYPQRIYGRMVRYVDEAADYEPRLNSDLDTQGIHSKTIHLAIPEYTSPEQWRYLLPAILYGKERGVRIVITRIRE
jgi:hypothetical protein